MVAALMTLLIPGAGPPPTRMAILLGVGMIPTCSIDAVKSARSPKPVEPRLRSDGTANPRRRKQAVYTDGIPTAAHGLCFDIRLAIIGAAVPLRNEPGRDRTRTTLIMPP